MTYCQKVICCCWLKREGSLEQSKAAWVTCCSRENQATHSASWLCSNASDFYIESRSPLLYKEWKIRILSFNRDRVFFLINDSWSPPTYFTYHLSRLQQFCLISLQMNFFDRINWRWFHHFPGWLLHISVCVVVTGHLILWNVQAFLNTIGKGSCLIAEGALWYARAACAMLL